MMPFGIIPEQLANFVEDVNELLQTHIVHRREISHLVQEAVPLGDLVDSLRCGRWCGITPKSGRAWRLWNKRGQGMAAFLSYLQDNGYRTFKHSRTLYVAPPPPAPLPPFLVKMAALRAQLDSAWSPVTESNY